VKENPVQRRKPAALAMVAMVLAACGQATPPAAAPSSGPLAGVCPNPVVVQTDWFAESEYGTYYQMLGDNPAFDTGKKRVTGPLVDAGAPTGVDLEIRYGGPAIGSQQVSAQMYTDPTITLGQVSTDEAVQNSDKLPTVAVVAPLEASPFMIMWDKAKHPDVTSVADLGRKGVQVLYFQSDTYMQYLLGAGLLQAGQVDGSYDGSPSRWVSSSGEIAQAGFATSEPYIYKAELGGGRSYDVGLQLIADTGYPLYGQALGVKAADKAKLAPCLAKLVPMIQRAQVAFAKDPARTNGVIVDAVRADRASVWSYSPGLAQFAVTAMRERGIIGNGPDATLGNLDPARVSRMIEILKPIFAAQNKPVKAGLTADQLFTNEFIDPAIGL
jgi:hypothetical protein